MYNNRFFMIESFSKNFFSTHRTSIMPITLSVIGGIELISLCSTIYQNPHCVKNSFYQLKNKIITPFKKQENEAVAQYYKRLLSLGLKATVSTIMITAAASLPFILLPSPFGIPLAILTIFSIGKYCFNWGRIESLYLKTKTHLIDCFSKRIDESDQDFKRRFALNIGKGIAIVALIAASVTLTTYIAGVFLPTACHMVVSGSGFSVYNALPFQNPVTVFVEYLIIGLFHLKKSFQALQKGEKLNALLYFINFGLSIFFPIKYLLGYEQMRLHHSFLGLMLQLIPYRPLQLFGSLLTFDSFLYTFSENRNGYDLINCIFANLTETIYSLFGIVMVEQINNHLKLDKLNEIKQKSNHDLLEKDDIYV